MAASPLRLELLYINNSRKIVSPSDARVLFRVACTLTLSLTIGRNSLSNVVAGSSRCHPLEMAFNPPGLLMDAGGERANQKGAAPCENLCSGEKSEPERPFCT